jgi:DNA-binding response OmpR family regulator
MRVLVCDDDPDVGGFLRSTFELEGWTASLTSSGEELLTAVDLDAPPAAVVLDQVMPGLTGLQTAARLRDSGFTQPIVLCSGHLGPELNQEIDRLDLIPVNKVDMDAVVRVVRAAVRASRRPARNG